MQRLLQDLGYALRMLIKAPGFSAVAVLTLALGIGANTAIFSVIHAVLLKSLPYPDADRLTILREYSVRAGGESVSWMDYLDWRQQNSSFAEMAAYNGNDFNWTGRGRPEVVHAARVTSSFFALTGATTILGRTFNAEEDKANVGRTAVVGYAFWRSHMGGDPGAVGESLTLDGEPYTVVGVLRPGFQYFTRPAELYVPAGLWTAAGSNWLVRGNHPGLEVLARLRPGATLATSRADMDTIMARIDKAFPESNSGQRASVKPLYEARFGNIQPALITLFAGVLCVLLIACANVANLSLARAAARQKEFAVRAAMGAGRRRIVRQLLTENILLALVGGGLGLVLAMEAIGPLVRLAPTDIPRLSETRMDPAVFLFSFGLALVTGILFGLAPAFQSSRVDLTAGLRESGHGATAGLRRQRLRTGLLIGEVAAAVVLVIASGLLTRSLLKALAVNPGFQMGNLLAIDTNLPLFKYKTDDQQLAFLNELLERARVLPGVESASAVLCPPLVGTCWDSIFYFQDRPVPPIAELPRAAFNIADTQYFRTLGVPLIEGRWFTALDTAKSTPVVVINQTAARRWWPHENPIGKRVKQGFPQDKTAFLEIVGVVGDLKQDGPDQEQWPEIFEPAAQNVMNAFTLVVRTKTEPLAEASAVEGAIHSLDADQPVYHVKTLTQYLAESLARRKFSALLLGVFGGLALLLAAVGIFGVIAYSVSQRTHEFGVRMALGAQSRSVLRMVMGQGAGLIALGLGIGLAAAAGVAQLMRNLLFAVAPFDVLTYAGVALLLAAIALLACAIPARRAMRVDPMVALRYE
jgi:putative ABC transport system permease protein